MSFKLYHQLRNAYEISPYSSNVTQSSIYNRVELIQTDQILQMYLALYCS